LVFAPVPLPINPDAGKKFAAISRLKWSLPHQTVSSPQRRDTEMSKKRNLSEDIGLIENLVQDQFNLIESRLRDLEQFNNPEEVLKKIIATLTELQDSCTLIKALLGNIRDNDNGHAIEAGAG
jgi:hypothetical protein